MDLSLNFQLLATGLAMGSIYALVALGFVLIFNAVNVVNFAQGEFVMVPAYVAVWMMTFLKLPFPLVYLITILFMGIFGITGVGVAWLVSQTLVAAVVLLTQLRSLWAARRPSGAVD